MKNLLILILILLSFNSESQIYPIGMELEIQKFEIDDINSRLNKSLDLISEAGRQRNLALLVGVSGSLISTLMSIKGKTQSVRNAGVVIGGLTLAGTIYFTIESNKRLIEVNKLKL